MIQPHPVLSAIIVSSGAFGMFVSGLCLELVLMGRRTWGHFALDLVPSLALLVVGWCVR